MRRYNLNFLLIFFLVSGSNACAQLDSAVHYLAYRYSTHPHTIKIPVKKNLAQKEKQEQDALVMYDYKKTDLYYYYQVDSLASDEELVKLTSHQSPIIQCYAAFALAQRDTLLLPGVLKKMLDTPVYAVCSNTDWGFEQVSASMIFRSLSQRKRATGYPTDNFMDSMYTILLLHRNTPRIEIGVLLLQPQSIRLKPAIETLAFERKNNDALGYMNRWHKREYYTQLNQTYLELLDSNIIEFSIPINKEIIGNLIDLSHEKTIHQLGRWLKNNRDKWVGIYRIDALLDKSRKITDSIKRGQQRYPFSEDEIKFLIGDWIIISGVDMNNSTTKDTIVLERPANQKGAYQILRYVLNKNGFYSYFYEAVNAKKAKMVGTPIFDAKNNRICLTRWDWYKIVKEEKRLVLLREKP